MEFINNVDNDIANQEFVRVNLMKQLLRDISNPFTLPRHYFRKYYRLTPEAALTLVNLLANDLQGQRITKIPAHIQVLMTLRFLATGQFQKDVGQDLWSPASQSTVCRVIDRVVDAILGISNMFVRLPANEQERQQTQARLQRLIRIPGVLGIIDGFLVCMIRPSENEEAFFNFKAGPSLNVQIAVDFDYNITNIRVVPGSNNDRHNWNHSGLKDYMTYLRENEEIVEQEGYYYILADSGYTPSTTLLTPVVNANAGTPEAAYTEEFVQLRVIVENTIGQLTQVWKGIKRCRVLYYKPEKVARIIKACAVMHNFRNMNGIPLPAIGFPNFVNINNNENRPFLAGVQERQRIIDALY